MNDLVAKIHAAIDEEERLALAARPGPWWHNPKKAWHWPRDLPLRVRGMEFVGAGDMEAPEGVAITGDADDPDAMATAAFIASQHRERALRRVATYRRLLEGHFLTNYREDAKTGRIEHQCNRCDWTPEEHLWEDGPACDVVMLIAADYGLVDTRGEPA